MAAIPDKHEPRERPVAGSIGRDKKEQVVTYFEQHQCPRCRRLVPPGSGVVPAAAVHALSLGLDCTKELEARIGDLTKALSARLNSYDLDAEERYRGEGVEEMASEAILRSAREELHEKLERLSKKLAHIDSRFQELVTKRREWPIDGMSGDDLRREIGHFEEMVVDPHLKDREDTVSKLRTTLADYQGAVVALRNFNEASWVKAETMVSSIGQLVSDIRDFFEALEVDQGDNDSTEASRTILAKAFERLSLSLAEITPTENRP
jgi:chemotaxis regulatin CheY-phosphate phosphatase CheZ